MIYLQSRAVISIFTNMKFFDDSDGSRTASDISDDDEDNLDGYQSEREEDIILRDGIQNHMLPRKNDWTFQSYSCRSSD